MADVFELKSCCNEFQFTDPEDSFESWNGLRGPAGPAGAPGPQGPPGTGLYISGTVATVEDLPETAQQSTMYNVGTSAPYTIYMYQEGQGWISQGQLEGPPGPAGPAGPAGADGAPGTPGTAATLAVGTVSGLPAGSTPTVTNSGSSSAAVFNFGIPAGATGATGPQGPQGEPGRGLTISGTVASVSQLPATAEQGTVYNVGASEPYELYMFQTGSGWISLGYLEGPEGPQGPAGPAGADGQPGAAATIAVGTVSGLPAGSTPTITNSGTSSAAVFNFGIPAGADGAQGPTGPAGADGQPGAAATIAVGTVSGLPAGSTPTVTNSGSSSAAVFDFGIPAGATGPQGAAGPGVAANGSTGQVLAKASDISYDTEWIDPPSGGGGWTLLWTNASPTSDFPAQTVTLDLTNYKMIGMLVRMNTAADTVYDWRFFSVGEYSFVRQLLNSGSSLMQRYRANNILTSGIVFEDCIDTTQGSTGRTNNGGNIPVKIIAN